MMLLELFWTFFKIGLFTFGGGYAMLPLIQSEVLAHQWMSTSDIVNFIAVSESTPGPFAVNISTYVGKITGGFPGALCATLGVILPSVLVILVVAKCYEQFKASSLVAGMMRGLRPTVVGLIAATVLSVGKSVFFPGNVAVDAPLLISAGIFLTTVILSLKKVHPILLIALSAAAGVIAGYALGL